MLAFMVVYQGDIENYMFSFGDGGKGSVAYTVFRHNNLINKMSLLQAPCRWRPSTDAE